MRAITFDGNIVSEAKGITYASTTSGNTITSRKKQDRSYAGNLYNYSSQINSLRNMMNGCRGKVEEDDPQDVANQSPHISLHQHSGQARY